MTISDEPTGKCPLCGEDVYYGYEAHTMCLQHELLKKLTQLINLMIEEREP